MWVWALKVISHNIFTYEVFFSIFEIEIDRRRWLEDTCIGLNGFDLDANFTFVRYFFARLNVFLRVLAAVFHWLKGRIWLWNNTLLSHTKDPIKFIYTYARVLSGVNRHVPAQTRHIWTQLWLRTARSDFAVIYVVMVTNFLYSVKKWWRSVFEGSILCGIGVFVAYA